ncbi:MAG: VWA domain-containing protein [Myxococcota bacterium]|nr:VWA domain-containing protein [Myxococcota bacterium]
MSAFGLWWETPWAFAALLLVPLLLMRLRSAGGHGRVPIPSDRSFSGVSQGLVARLWWLPDALRVLAVCALVFALARPQTEDRQVITGEGVDIMVALDMSGSMNAVDMTEDDLEEILSEGETPPSRFASATEILEQFILSRSQDRIGLVVFGEAAWLKYPLSLDYSRLVQTLDELVLDNGAHDPQTGRCVNACTISGAGTALGDALGRSYNRLRRSDASSRVVVLITDGKREGGTLDPMAITTHIASQPSDQQVRVFTFQVGSQEQVWVPRLDHQGRQATDMWGRPIYARPGNPLPTDPELLQRVAEITGGKYYESYSAEKFRSDIKDLEKTVFSSRVHTTRSDVFGGWALAGLLLLAAEIFLRATRWRTLV